MEFANSKLLLKEAQKKHYAIGAFNFQDMEILQAIVEAANKEKSPVILAASHGAIDYIGIDHKEKDYKGIKYLTSMAKIALQQSKVPLILHLDHGDSYELAISCIRHGFSSVMIDASHYNFKKNIQITKKVVKYAHKHNVSVEAELGQLKGIEDLVASSTSLLTDPDSAKEFVEKTNCDSLAVAIGTSHGAYKFKGSPKLDFARLKLISQKVKVPLVLHGASSVQSSLIREAIHYGAKLSGAQGVPNNQIKRAIKLGITKINTDTDLRLQFITTTRRIIKTQPDIFDIRKIMGSVRDDITKLVQKRIKLFGSSGKAR